MCQSNGLQVLPTNSVRSPPLPELLQSDPRGEATSDGDAHDAKQVPQWRRRPAFVVRDRLRAGAGARQPRRLPPRAYRPTDSARRTRAVAGSPGPLRPTPGGLRIDAGGPSRWLECSGGRPRPHLGIGRVPPLARQRLQRTATRDHGTGPVPGWGPRAVRGLRSSPAAQTSLRIGIPELASRSAPGCTSVTASASRPTTSFSVSGTRGKASICRSWPGPSRAATRAPDLGIRCLPRHRHGRHRHRCPDRTMGLRRPTAEAPLLRMLLERRPAGWVPVPQPAGITHHYGDGHVCSQRAVPRAGRADVRGDRSVRDREQVLRRPGGRRILVPPGSLDVRASRPGGPRNHPSGSGYPGLASGHESPRGR